MPISYRYQFVSTQFESHKQNSRTGNTSAAAEDYASGSALNAASGQLWSGRLKQARSTLTTANTHGHNSIFGIATA